MKIIKHKHGYSIRLTDNEFTAFEKSFNTTHISLLWSILTRDERYAYSRRCGAKRDKYFLRVDDDRRES